MAALFSQEPLLDKNIKNKFAFCIQLLYTFVIQEKY